MQPDSVTSIRAGIKHSAIKAMHLAGLLKSARHNIARSGNTLVLTLHRVIPDSHIASCRSPRGMVLRASAFGELLAYLKEHAIVVTPASISKLHLNEERPRVLLTFDDGWSDNASIAAPLMARFGISACFFAVTSYAGASQPFWPEHALGLVRALDRAGRKAQVRDVFSALQKRQPAPSQIEEMSEEQLLNWLKQFRPAIIRSVIMQAEQQLSHDLAMDLPDPWERLMTWKELQNLARAGHTIASHTSTHALLTQLHISDISSELAESAAQIQRCIGTGETETQWISYPNGNSDSMVHRLAYENGYRYGFTTTPGIWNTDSEPLAIPRINVWDGTLLSPQGTFDEHYLEYNLFWRSLRQETA